MEEKIRQILMENNLYNNYSLNANLGNQLETFFETYKMNPTNKQRIPENSLRDNEGRIILDYISFVSSNVFEKTYKKENIWLVLNNGTKLLIKANREHKYNELELLIMYFFKSLDMSCANYDIATYKGVEYLGVTSFLKKEEEITIPFSNTPKITDAYEQLKSYGSQLHFLKTCFVDRIIGNIDWFPNNFGVIKNNADTSKRQNMRICPLFDNVEDTLIFIREEKFGFFPYLDDEIISSCSEIINRLLGYEELMHWACGPLKKANLFKCANRHFLEKGVSIDNKTYKEAESFFKDSEVIINEELKNKGKSFKISLI